MFQNWRKGHYEIDIIARKANRLHLIEVKTRSFYNYGVGMDDVKMEHLMLAVEKFIQEVDWVEEFQLDLMIVLGFPQNYSTQYIPDIYELG